MVNYFSMYSPEIFYRSGPNAYKIQKRLASVVRWQRASDPPLAPRSQRRGRSPPFLADKQFISLPFSGISWWLIKPVGCSGPLEGVGQRDLRWRLDLAPNCGWSVLLVAARSVGA